MKKIALITGATSGIGEACAAVFAGHGYRLLVTGRRADRLQELATRLKHDYGTDVLPLCFDVQNRSAVEAALLHIPEEWQNIDLFINNAGLSLGLDPIDKGNPDDWDIMLNTNVKGLLYVTGIVSKWMVRRRSGHIINIGSIAGKEVYPNGNVYCATKYAVDALNKGMRVDLLPYGIKVSGIHPGAVSTAFSEVRFKGDAARAKNVYAGFTPLSAQDVADAIFFVASCPVHVNINDLVIMPTAQASTTQFFKTGLDAA